MIETRESKDKKTVYMYCSTEKRESDVEVHGEHEDMETTLYECSGMNRSSGLLPTVPAHFDTTSVSKITMLDHGC